MGILSNYNNPNVPNGERVIFALTMEDVFDIAEELEIDRTTVEANIESIYKWILSGFECNWTDVIETALDNINREKAATNKD
jgi:hypothetical protein